MIDRLNLSRKCLVHDSNCPFHHHLAVTSYGNLICSSLEFWPVQAFEEDSGTKYHLFKLSSDIAFTVP